MAANTQLAGAIHILCFIAHAGKDGTNAEILAKSLRTNPVVVRRTLKPLEHAGLVEIRQGKDGGVRLRRSPEEITLDQIYEAIGADAGIFALRPDGNPKCIVNRSMPDLLTPVFGAAHEAVRDTLRQIRLSSLTKPIG